MASPFTPPNSSGSGSEDAATETTLLAVKAATEQIPPSPSTTSTQPVSAAALPLPANAARDSTLTDGSQRVGGTVVVNGSGVTQPVSAAALPLPAGAATEATLANVKTGTDKIPASPATDRTTAAAPGSVRLSDGAAFFKPTTPTDTQPVSAAALPLPAGAATAALQPKSREDTVAMTWASSKTAAPAASAVQATTGALAAGDYDFDIELLCSDIAAVGKGMVVEHRNAADNATLQTLGGCSVPGQIEIHLRRYTIATNERIRVIAGTAAGAASSMYVSAIGRRFS